MYSHVYKIFTVIVQQQKNLHFNFQIVNPQKIRFFIGYSLTSLLTSLHLYRNISTVVMIKKKQQNNTYR